MVNEINYISINELASRVLDNTLLSDINIEQIIRHVLDFMAKFGVNNIYQDKEAILTVQEYRALLPCDLIRIMQLKDCKSGLCFRQMTSSYIPTDNDRDYELTFKTQGRVLYTSIKECEVKLAYKAIPVDDDGFPLLIDNPLYLKTLELYIKKEIYGNLFDQGKLNQNILNHVEQQYAWNVGQLQSEFNTPSVQEIESIKNMWTSLLQYNNHFVRDFKYGNSNHNKIV